MQDIRPTWKKLNIIGINYLQVFARFCMSQYFSPWIYHRFQTFLCANIASCNMASSLMLFLAQSQCDVEYVALEGTMRGNSSGTKSANSLSNVEQLDASGSNLLLDQLLNRPWHRSLIVLSFRISYYAHSWWLDLSFFDSIELSHFC